MPHKLKYAGGELSPFHKELMGEPLDFSSLRLSDYSPAILEDARRIWHNRFHTEFRSVQIMTRFLTEILGAGDPMDVYAGAVDMIQDEIRHAALCAEVCRALKFDPVFPDPLVISEPPDFLKASMGERALHTAITMLGISETLSSGFILDLKNRCKQPAIHDILRRTIEDEDGHHGFGWAYIQASLRRFPSSTLSDWRHLVRITLAPHFDTAAQFLADVPASQKNLDSWPDEEVIPLGLFSPQRHALVFLQTYETELKPKLASLQLLP